MIKELINKIHSKFLSLLSLEEEDGNWVELYDWKFLLKKEINELEEEIEYYKELLKNAKKSTNYKNRSNGKTKLRKK